MEQRGQELDNWTEIIKKAVDVEAQASLQPSFYIKEIDQECLRGNWPNSTKASTQSNSIKDSRTEKPWFKLQEHKASAPQYQAEASENARKKKKKEDQWFGQDQKHESSTPATKVNIAKFGEQG